MSPKNYDQRATEDENRRKKNFAVDMQNERLKFQQEIQQLPKPRIAHGRWINALTNDHFSWQLTVTFPHKLPKDERMERFIEAIQNAYKRIYLS